jgi:hypothetical protein
MHHKVAVGLNLVTGISKLIRYCIRQDIVVSCSALKS